MTLHELGHAWLRRLRGLEPTPTEAEALARLEAFQGTAADIRALAAACERAGRSEEARDLLALLEPV